MKLYIQDFEERGCYICIAESLSAAKSIFKIKGSIELFNEDDNLDEEEFNNTKIQEIELKSGQFFQFDSYGLYMRF